MGHAATCTEVLYIYWAYVAVVIYALAGNSVIMKVVCCTVHLSFEAKENYLLKKFHHNTWRSNTIEEDTSILTLVMFTL